MVGRSISGIVDVTNKRTTYVSVEAFTASHDAQQEGKYEAMIYISFSNTDPQREHDSAVSRHLEFNNNAIRISTQESLETPEEDPVIADLCEQWGVPAVDAREKDAYVSNEQGLRLLQQLERLQPTDFTLSQEDE